MDNLTIAELGLVLAKMAKIAQDKAKSQQHHLGSHNTELLWILSRILGEGCDCCLNLAKEKIDG